VRRLIILHPNDIHGRVDALARLATVLDDERARADAPAVYLDAGDVEETTYRLSNLTKGVAMHRLLRVAGCRAVAVGNGAVIRYGVEPLVEQASVGGYPHLAANLRRNGHVVPGAQAGALADVDGIQLGLVGLTPTNWRDIYEDIFGLQLPDEAQVVRAEASALRAAGAELVVLLSHVGLERDRELAVELADELDLIVGSHSHHLLPAGERVAGVTIVQVGEFGEHLGRVELEIGDAGVRVVDVRVRPVPLDTSPHPAVLREVEAIERELEEYLAEIIGELEAPLDFAADRECAAANFMADVVRERMAAEVAVMTAAAAFAAGLPAGPLSRGTLYEACPSPGNPGVASMTGAQLKQLVTRGLDPELARDVPRTFRGAQRGLMHLSGAEVRDGRLLVAGEVVDHERTYRVAGSDWELDSYGGYAEPAWGLEVEYDHPTIMREAVEDHLRRHRLVAPPAPRVHSSSTE
jgi:2',3'-cyclic-nucleotide 2'-phosphodiesterase (5'-nucleotidase family)